MHVLYARFYVLLYIENRCVGGGWEDGEVQYTRNQWGGYCKLGGYVFLLARAALTKHQKLGTLQQKFTVSQFWSLRVWNQCVSRAVLPDRWWRESVLTFSSFWCLPAVLGLPWLASLLSHGSLFPVCLHISPLYCLFLSTFPFFYKDTSLTGLGSILMASF